MPSLTPPIALIYVLFLSSAWIHKAHTQRMDGIPFDAKQNKFMWQTKGTTPNIHPSSRNAKSNPTMNNANEIVLFFFCVCVSIYAICHVRCAYCINLFFSLFFVSAFVCETHFNEESKRSIRTELLKELIRCHFEKWKAIGNLEKKI